MKKNISKALKESTVLCSFKAKSQTNLQYEYGTNFLKLESFKSFCSL